MAYPAWPDGVKFKPRRDDYQIAAPHLPPLATDMNAGNVRMRRQFTSAIGQLRYNIQMPQAQFETFKAWERDTLGQGSSRFTVPIYYGSAGWVTKTCWLEKGTYIAVPSKAAGNMEVSFTLNVLDF